MKHELEIPKEITNHPKVIGKKIIRWELNRPVVPDPTHSLYPFIRVVKPGDYIYLDVELDSGEKFGFQKFVPTGEITLTNAEF